MRLQAPSIAGAACLVLGALGCSTPSGPDRSEVVPRATPSGDPVLVHLRGMLGEARRAKQDRYYADAHARISEAIAQALAQLEGRDDAPACALLLEMGRFAQDSGDFRGAEKAQRRAFEVLSRTQPDDHRDLQQARQALALTIKRLGDPQGARVLEEEVLEVFSRTMPDDQFELQGARGNLAGTLFMLGDLHGARALFEKVVEVFTRTLPDDHLDLQRARGALAMTIGELGDLQGARALEEEVVLVLTRTRPDDSPDLQWAHTRLASTIHDLGDLQGAGALIERVLEIQIRTLPEENPDLQATRIMFAATIRQLGDPQRARALLERVLEVLSRTRPDDSLDLQKVRGNLALTIKSLGDLQGARALEERVLEVFSRALPEDHPDLQRARQNLAVTIKDQGDLEGARALEEEILAVYTRTLPEDHPDVMTLRQNLAVTFKRLGDFEEARALEKGVLEALSRTLPDDHPDLQCARWNLAATLFDLGEFRPARELCEEALMVGSRTLPEDHPELGVARANMAWAIAGFQARGGGTSEREGRARCTGLLLSSCRARVSAAREALLSSSPREAQARCEFLAAGLDDSLSIAREGGAFEPTPELDRASFVLSETTRGAALGAAVLMRQARSAPGYSELRSASRRASEELAELAQQRGTTSDAFRTALERRDGIQRDLARIARELGGGSPAGLDFDVDALAARLSQTDAVVGFRRYLRSTVVPSGDGLATTSARGQLESAPSLCALVLRRSADSRGSGAAGTLTRVELGPLDPIEEAVKVWRGSLGLGSDPRGVTPGSTARDRPSPGASDALGRALRRLVFDPLLPALEGTDHVVFALDDVLHLVPMDALPLEEDSSVPARALLGESRKIEIRATLAELLAPVRPGKEGGELVAVGGVSYDTAQSRARPEGRAGILRGGAWSTGFPDLPATSSEVEEIARNHREQHEGGIVTLLAGGDATREKLLELAPRARWLHVATHGWFAPESVRSWEDPEPVDRIAGLQVRSSGEEQIQGMSPMLLCGLALAGANLPESELGRIPGLVTAEELSALDLSNCELAVLSACDTNVGEHRAGQGVASLQLALQMAGARSVITSLWKVPDGATRELMTDFYRRMWVEKKPKAQALWEAKMEIREARDEAGKPKYSTRDWAAWVLTGDPN